MASGNPGSGHEQLKMASSAGGFSKETEHKLRELKDDVDKKTNTFGKDGSKPHREALDKAKDALSAAIKEAHENDGGAGAEKQVKLVHDARAVIAAADKALRG
jgi:hypothetical protein